MASVNKVILLGTLGRDPEVRFSANQLPIASLSLATSSFRRSAETYAYFLTLEELGA